MALALVLVVVAALLVALLYHIYRTQRLHRLFGWTSLRDEQLPIAHGNAKCEPPATTTAAKPMADVLPHANVPLAVKPQTQPLRSDSVTSDNALLESMDSSTLRCLARAQSTESVQSNCAHEHTCDMHATMPQIELRIAYEQCGQLLRVSVIQAVHVQQALGSSSSSSSSVCVVIFLLPHPKPLWRTKLCALEPEPVQVRDSFVQCVRTCDLSKVALLAQLYATTDGSGSSQLLGQCKLRLKDIDLLDANTLWLTCAPQLEAAAEEESIGQLLCSLSYAGDRLTVLISKIKQLSLQPIDDQPPRVRVRVYVVYGAHVTRKKSSVQTLDADGQCTFNESLLFPLPSTKLNRAHVRVCVSRVLSGGEHTTLGQVTLGPSCSDRQLGHWQQMGKQQHGKPVAMWHHVLGATAHGD